ncbi:MAG: hypothetical protein LIP05_05470 [Tannerellaceae bacterium]|nr:hypothetical protein [Tannerellaceae bacterium]
MHKLSVLLLSCIALSACLLFSCSDWEDNISTNPAHQLSFSVDTVDFDVVFTTIGSATREFLIYNWNSKPLHISSISIANHENSGFRINVDGRKGTTFSDITILEKDSIYVLVEVTVNPTGENQPALIEDKINFLTNGSTQSVQLKAYGQDAHLIKDGYRFAQDTFLTAEKPYLIYDSIEIAAGTTVEIEAGATFYMHNKAKWLVKGRLIARGTMAYPILFRGDRLDYLETDRLYDRIPGQWDGIYFSPESFENELDYVIIRNTVGGVMCEESTPDRLKLTITNSQLTNSDQSVLQAINCFIEVGNTELSNAVEDVVALYGGKYNFTHCTLANYMNRKTRTSGTYALYLSNFYTTVNEEKVFPLVESVFENCIIDGSFSDELGIEKKENSTCNYQFNYCTIKSPVEGSGFTHIQIGSPAYLNMGNRDNDYYFDFRLAGTDEAEQGYAIGNGDPAIAEKYPYDRYGVYRLTDGKAPDVGAYVYVPPTTD